MSEAITSYAFHSEPRPPLMRSGWAHPADQIANQVRGLITATALSVALVNASPAVTFSLSTKQLVLRGEPHPNPSSAELTRRPAQARMTGFVVALNEAIELSEIMVTEDEGITLNAHTMAYAIQVLIPLVTAADLPAPLMLPLQDGGLSVEWHSNGLNIEMRFRKPYDVWVVVEDVEGAISSVHGRDPNLAQARAALHELNLRRTV